MPFSLNTYREHRKSIEYCTFCPKMCRFSCPVAQVEASDTLTPTGKMTLLYLLGKGLKKPNPEIVEPIYKCTGCIHCFIYCAHRNMLMPVYYKARAELNSFAGKSISEQVEKYRQNFFLSANPFGDRITQKLRELFADSRGDGNEILFFAGCTEPNFFPQSSKRVFSLLSALEPGVVPHLNRNICCGVPLMNAGLVDEFIENARIIADSLNRFNLVISNCPACVFVLKEVYKSSGVELGTEVKTAVEFIAENINRLKLNDGIGDGSAIYHDPCYLGRYRKVFQEPRRLIKAMGFELKEFSWNSIDSECCGASLSHLLPELSGKIAMSRLNSMPGNDIAQIITSCPSCRRQFSKFTVIKIVDVADEIAKRVVD